MAYFGPAQRVSLSKDSRHVLSELERFRDNIRISSMVAGLSVVSLGYSSLGHSELATTIASAAMGVGAVWVAKTAKQSHDVIAQKIEQIAQASDQAMPNTKRQLLHENDVGPLLKTAEIRTPGLVEQIINRRKRSWEDALEVDYRPAPRQRS